MRGNDQLGCPFPRQNWDELALVGLRADPQQGYPSFDDDMLMGQEDFDELAGNLPSDEPQQAAAVHAPNSTAADLPAAESLAADSFVNDPQAADLQDADLLATNLMATD